MTRWRYLIHVELVLTSGQLSVAGGELSNKVVTAETQNIPAGFSQRPPGVWSSTPEGGDVKYRRGIKVRRESEDLDNQNNQSLWSLEKIQQSSASSWDPEPVGQLTDPGRSYNEEKKRTYLPSLSQS